MDKELDFYFLLFGHAASLKIFFLGWGVGALSIQLARVLSDDKVKLSANYFIGNDMVCILPTNRLFIISLLVLSLS